MGPSKDTEPSRTDDGPLDRSADPEETLTQVPSDVREATHTFFPEEGSTGSARSKASPPVSLPSIPGYEVLSVLGRGGMGVVYQARHLALKRTVALKMVLAGGHASPSELTRFRIEAEAVARLQHPNIVQIHDVGEVDGQPYCALEFVEGGTLADRLEGKPLPPRAGASLVEALARAMQTAHRLGVVHRDLKPANVLLAADGTPKITDFGLARHLDSDSGQTQAGAVMGSPSYMAPEQASGRAHEAGPAADIYALGAILYECLTGRPPFRGESVAETLVLVRTADPVRPSRIQPRVPRDLETICLKAIAKEPGRRYATAGDLAADLHRFLNDEPILARPVALGEKLWRRMRRNPAIAGLAMIVVALTGIVIGIVASRPNVVLLQAPGGRPAAHTPTDTSADDLLRITAELDRTDPDWRYERLEAARKPIPDDQNGALQIIAFRKIVADMTGRPKSEGNWVHPDLVQRLNPLLQLGPTEPVNEADLRDFQAELKRVEPALTQARQMIRYPEGRFPIAYTRDFFSILLPDHQATRQLVHLLLVDAMIQLQRGNPDEAIRDCRAILNCPGAFNGESIGIAQAIRLSVLRSGLRLLERILHHGRIPDAELQSLQRMLAAESDYPMHTIIARGERAINHYFLGALHTGDASPATLEMFGLTSSASLPSGSDLRRLHVWMLQHSTKWVETSRLPPDRWASRIAQLDADQLQSPLIDTPVGQSLRKLSSPRQNMEPALEHLAIVRSTLAALAAERFRQAHGEWPANLEALVPAYLNDVPADPYNGRPIRYRRTADGVVAYCLGLDASDDQSHLHRTGSLRDGQDVGFQLWDLAQRLRPAPPGKP